ncbi:hypothetical protein IV203_003736 [Nitzschia inconspicua]|uniref:Uncharacterized protein n=1 Tax=Nitzschia inconspicua TaxID=303405 RepID=A0A9K3L2C0_9STRA|nr:hypothetical protein IV203_003736 [Nitzschia inconspicua]
MVEVVSEEIHNLTAGLHIVIEQRLHVEFVVSFRRPRDDHWRSIWKQLTRNFREEGNPQHEYSSFICNDDTKPMVWEYLDTVANPLGLAKTLLETFMMENHQRVNSSASEEHIVSFDRVHVLDMQGIAEAGLDISHVVSCDVLDVGRSPEGWLDVSDAKGKSGASFNTTKATIKKNQNYRMNSFNVWKVSSDDEIACTNLYCNRPS